MEAYTCTLAVLSIFKNNALKKFTFSSLREDQVKIKGILYRKYKNICYKHVQEMLCDCQVVNKQIFLCCRCPHVLKLFFMSNV